MMECDSFDEATVMQPYKHYEAKLASPQSSSDTTSEEACTEPSKAVKTSSITPDEALQIRNTVLRSTSCLSKKRPTSHLTCVTHHRPSTKYGKLTWHSGPSFISFYTIPPKVITAGHYDEKHKNWTYFDQSFTSQQCIGKGSFGEVFKALSRDDGRWYAVKIAMKPFGSGSDRSLELKEVKNHELLPPHPNLLIFVCAWEEDNYLYIQTELCKYSLLAHKFIEKNLSEEDRWLCFLDVAMAIRHLHNHNLLHLDIKTPNIMISFDGICKLGDFSLLRDMNEDSIAEIDGDAKFLAPEALGGHVSQKTDIFALGMTMMDICTEYDLPTSGSLWHDIRESKIPSKLIGDMSPQMLNLVLKLIEKTPEARPSAVELCEDVAFEKYKPIREARLAKIESSPVPSSSYVEGGLSFVATSGEPTCSKSFPENSDEQCFLNLTQEIQDFDYAELARAADDDDDIIQENDNAFSQEIHAIRVEVLADDEYCRKGSGEIFLEITDENSSEEIEDHSDVISDEDGTFHEKNNDMLAKRPRSPGEAEFIKVNDLMKKISVSAVDILDKKPEIEEGCFNIKSRLRSNLPTNTNVSTAGNRSGIKDRSSNKKANPAKKCIPKPKVIRRKGRKRKCKVPKTNGRPIIGVCSSGSTTKRLNPCKGVHRKRRQKVATKYCVCKRYSLRSAHKKSKEKVASSGRGNRNHHARSTPVRKKSASKQIFNKAANTPVKRIYTRSYCRQNVSQQKSSGAKLKHVHCDVSRSPRKIRRILYGVDTIHSPPAKKIVNRRKRGKK